MSEQTLPTDAFKAAATGWDAYLAVDKGGQVVDGDEAMARLLGFAPGALVGLSIDALLPRRVRGWHTDVMRSAIDEGHAFVDMSPAGRTIAAIDAHGKPVELLAKYTTVDGHGLLLANVPPDEDTVPLDLDTDNDTETDTNG